MNQIKIRWNRALAGMVAIAAIGLVLPMQAGASRSSTDAIARLESHAGELRRELIRPPKEGPADRAEIRSQIRAIRTEVARLESGQPVDASRLASLTDQPDAGVATSPAALAKRAAKRQEALERRLRPGGPKLGSLGRKAVRQDLEQLDIVIAALESGEEVDPEQLDALLGMLIADASKRPIDRLQESEMRLATLKRKLLTGPKLGIRGRAEVREEIEALDRLIERLEAEVER